MTAALYPDRFCPNRFYPNRFCPDRCLARIADRAAFCPSRTLLFFNWGSVSRISMRWLINVLWQRSKYILRYGQLHPTSRILSTECRSGAAEKLLIPTNCDRLQSLGLLAQKSQPFCYRHFAYQPRYPCPFPIFSHPTLFSFASNRLWKRINFVPKIKIFNSGGRKRRNTRRKKIKKIKSNLYYYPSWFPH